MRKPAWAAILAVLGWQGYDAYQRASLAFEQPAAEFTEHSADEGIEVPVSEDSRFSGDGRTHCSQMTSCDEAPWFIDNCPGTEMDGVPFMWPRTGTAHRPRQAEPPSLASILTSAP
jgi:hypothetical protein